MGGLGSGRREYATTPTVGECHTIDVNNLTDLVTHPGGVARYPWHDEYGHGEQVAEIGIGVERDGEPRFTPAVDGVERADVADALGDRATHLRLRYTAAPESDDPREYD